MATRSRFSAFPRDVQVKSDGAPGSRGLRLCPGSRASVAGRQPPARDRTAALMVFAKQNVVVARCMAPVTFAACVSKTSCHGALPTYLVQVSTPAGLRYEFAHIGDMVCIDRRLARLARFPECHSRTAWSCACRLHGRTHDSVVKRMWGTHWVSVTNS